MNGKIIAVILLSATLGIVALAVWQQQRRLPELEARRPRVSDSVTPPPGLGKEGGSPLEFASLYQNLKPEKQKCFREKFGEERLQKMLEGSTFVPSPDDNRIIGECLFAGTTFEGDGVQGDSVPQ